MKDPDYTNDLLFDVEISNEVIMNAWVEYACPKSTLIQRSYKLLHFLSLLKNNKKFSFKKTHVSFRNAVSMIGLQTFDEIQIRKAGTQKMLYRIMFRENIEVLGHENSFTKPLVVGSRNDILNFFNG